MRSATAALIISVGFLVSSLYGYSGGSGTEEDPYHIATAQDLIDLGYSAVDYDKHFILTSDIDLADYSFTKAVIAGNSVPPRGAPQVSFFGGVFDGNDHVIRNLYVDGYAFLGLFERLQESAVVRDLALEQISVRGTGYDIGGLAGWNYGTIVNCCCSGMIVGGTHIGGLVGRNYGTIVNCCCSGTVTGDRYVGGLAASNYRGSISQSYSTCTVEGGTSIGGLVGSNSEGLMLDCHCTGTVVGEDSDVGGLVGENQSGTISNSYSAGKVTGGDYSTGGLVGYNREGDVLGCYSTGTPVAGRFDVGGLVGQNYCGTVSNCYSTGAVSGMQDIGGLIGLSYRGYVSNCYSAGAVAGSGWYVGGLVGSSWGPIVRSFWDTESSGKNFSAGGAGLTTAKMKDPQWIALQGWASDPNWVLDPHLDYPHLVWEGTEGGPIPEPNVDWMVGQGTEEVPYQINDPDQLLAISKANLLWEKHLVLATDLDLQGMAWPQSVIPYFTGTFDGNGHVIENLSITGYSDVAFVGRLDSTGTVQNLGLRDVQILGHEYYVGGLVGRSYGRVLDCYSTGIVTGYGTVGGLVGYSDSQTGCLANCYSLCAVSGDRQVGGLVGWIGRDASISGCYSAGAIEGDEEVGGLVGKNDRGRVIGSFWDAETSGLSQSQSGIGLTTAEMMDPEKIGLQGWGNDPHWVLDFYQDYPRLAWEGTPGQMIPEPAIDWIVGQGTSESPYEISDPSQLISISQSGLFWRKALVLTADLDLADVLWTQAVLPYFRGSFDGNGHVIENLRISGDHDLGLIAYLDDEGTVSNLSLVDADVTGTGERTAGLVAYSLAGVVSDCNVTGSIQGDRYAAGLVAYNSIDAAVSNCRSTAVVTGGNVVGGLVGYNDHGTVVDGHTAGLVTGSEFVGGTLGCNRGSISGCWDAGETTGDQWVGGLLGYNDNGGSVSQCWSTGLVIGYNDVGGLVGRNHFQCTVSTSYATATVEGQHDIGGLVGYNYVSAITNCYSTGEVSGDHDVGGLIGSSLHGSVSKCYSVGAVTGVETVGGLVGEDSRSEIEHCFWDSQSSGCATSDGGQEATTGQMRNITTFVLAKWDFVDETANGTEDIWWIDQGLDYPRLYWELSQ